MYVNGLREIHEKKHGTSVCVYEKRVVESAPLVSESTVNSGTREAWVKERVARGMLELGVGE